MRFERPAATDLDRVDLQAAIAIAVERRMLKTAGVCRCIDCRLAADWQIDRAE